MGMSRGSELALWVGALLDTIGAVPGTPVVTEVRRHPLTGGSYSFGGTRAGNALARADSWPRVVAFLRDALG